jgi:RES domain-containing protein|tara:strand:- start:44 stop:358 length:315 start_codon:yes stop_codon:yes gene_type:complete
MRIKITETGDEFQVSLNAEGNSVAGGRYFAHEGVLVDGVEDITVFKTVTDEDGNEIQVEVNPDIPNEDWSKTELKAYMDNADIAYNSGDSKAVLLEKIAEASDE